MVLEVVYQFLPVPTIISKFMEWVIILFILVFSDVLIAHSIEFKKLLILSLIAYLITPFALDIAPVSYPFTLLVPLILWIILSEILLREASVKQKAIIATLAYITYLILTFLNVPIYVRAVIGI